MCVGASEGEGMGESEDGMRGRGWVRVGVLVPVYVYACTYVCVMMCCTV